MKFRRYLIPIQGVLRDDKSFFSFTKKKKLKDQVPSFLDVILDVKQLPERGGLV